MNLRGIADKIISQGNCLAGDFNTPVLKRCCNFGGWGRDGSNYHNENPQSNPNSKRSQIDKNEAKSKMLKFIGQFFLVSKFKTLSFYRQ